MEERLTEAEKITLSQKAASIEVLIKTPTRIQKIAADIQVLELIRQCKRRLDGRADPSRRP